MEDLVRAGHQSAGAAGAPPGPFRRTPLDDNKNKVLRCDVVLYTVSAMLFMDQIALASSPRVRRACSLWLYVLPPAVPCRWP